MKTQKYSILFAAACFLLVFGTSAMGQNLLVNGDFEEPVVSNGNWSTFYNGSVPGWEIVSVPGINYSSDGRLGPELEVWHNLNVYPPQNGNQNVELDSYHPCAIQQSITTQAGHSYELSLWYSPRPGVAINTINVYWNGSQIDLLNGTVAEWINFKYTVLGTGGVVTVKLEDGSPDEATGGLGGLLDNISLILLNDPPDAVDDIYTAEWYNQLIVDAPGVLLNDTDPENDPLTVDSYTQPTNGTVTVNQGGSFTYTPFPGFWDTDSFTYTVSDGNGGTDTATVTITFERVAYELCAGQSIPVGSVLVADDGENLYVKYVLDPDGPWCLMETHTATSMDVKKIGKVTISGIPQTEDGNPIPGQFLYKQEEIPFIYTDGCTKESDVILIPISGNPTCIQIAAHAVVVNNGEEFETNVYSDTETIVTYSKNNPVLAGGQPAVFAWEHSNWTDTKNLFSTSADWIWVTETTQDPDPAAVGVSIIGDIVRFERSFKCGYPLSAELKITTDNGYEVFLNGAIIDSAQVAGDWRESNLTEVFVQTNGWNTIEVFDILAMVLSGENLMVIDAANEYMGILDDQADGTIYSNPAGLIYELVVEWLQEETAWGGCGDTGFPFDGNNWATYIEYCID